jgi:hypothetical protein
MSFGAEESSGVANPVCPIVHASGCVFRWQAGAGFGQQGCASATVAKQG